MEGRFIEEYCLYDYTSMAAEKVSELNQLGCKNIQVLSTKSYSEPKTELFDKRRTSRWEFECSDDKTLNDLSKYLTLYKSTKGDNKYIVFITEDTNKGKVQTKELKSDLLIQPMPLQDKAEEKQTAEILKLIAELRGEVASRVCFNKSRKQKKLRFLEEVIGFNHLGFSLKDSVKHTMEIKHTVDLENSRHRNELIHDEEVYKGSRVKKLIEAILPLQFEAPRLR